MKKFLLLASLMALFSCGYELVPTEDAHTAATLEGLSKIADLARDLEAIR